MDINLLSRMLHELLLEHDQVGLPGVGTFVAEVAPATFADKGYIVNPPFRKLVFHPNCLEDELLVDFYATSNKLERSIADAYIKDFLSEMKRVLLDRKSLFLPELGRLRATKSNNVFFIPCEDLDIYPEGFGLAPLSMKTHMEMDDEVAIDVRPRLYRNPAPEPEVVPESGSDDCAGPESESVPSVGQEEHDRTESEEESQVDNAVLEHANHERAVYPLEFEEYMESGFKWWIIPLILLALAVIAFCVFVIIAQIDPEILYPILYSPEELRILYS